MILSIIVPVYGVEVYIEQCISSLLVPGFNDYEILVVNDGTKDRSIDIIQQKFQDERIRIIHQENKGLSAARNFGLREAKGEYIWFFDSDDWAETDLIIDLVRKMREVDVIIQKCHYVNIESTQEEYIRSYLLGTDSIESLISSSYPHPVQFYIYRKKFLQSKQISFFEGIFHEDTLFTPTTLPRVENFSVLNIPVYHYRKRDGSITHNITVKHILDLLEVVSKLLKYGQNELSPQMNYKWGRALVAAVNELLYDCCKLDNKEMNEKVCLFLNNNRNLINYFCNSHSFKQRTIGLLAKLLRGNLFVSYKFLYRFRY